jgi:hypothetical protein
VADRTRGYYGPRALSFKDPGADEKTPRGALYGDLEHYGTVALQRSAALDVQAPRESGGTHKHGLKKPIGDRTTEKTLIRFFTFATPH